MVIPKKINPEQEIPEEYIIRKRQWIGNKTKKISWEKLLLKIIRYFQSIFLVTLFLNYILSRWTLILGYLFFVLRGWYLSCNEILLLQINIKILKCLSSCVLNN